MTAAVATLAMPVAFRFLIDEAFGGRAAAAATLDADVNVVFLSLFGLAIVLAVSTAVRFYCVAWLGERVTADMRQDIFARVLRQDPLFFESLKTGEVLTRLGADTTLIQALVGTSISLGLRNAFLFVGAFVMMVLTSPTLAGYIVALLAVVVLPILVAGRRVRRMSRDSQDRLADTGALAGEVLGAVQLVQAYVREDFESGRYRELTDTAFASAVRRNRSRALLTVLAIVLVFGSIVFVLWLGAQAVMDGRLSAGLLTQFMLYAALVGGTVGVIAEVYGDLQRASGATERLMELLDARPSIVDRPGAMPPAATRADRTARGTAVEFDRVCFRYPSRPDTQAVDAVSFSIASGETVAVVGPSGAGKSTLFQLLLRFHEPESGTIRLDGRALDALPLDALRGQIGLVAQDSVVFSASARDNIRYGRLDARDDEIERAAALAEADDFIRALPDGYDTYLGERGVRLSGGQRQRLSIARALLGNPPLLLLDEATSALDTDSERKVQAALSHAMTGRTTLVIAHRLATVVHADRIVVMDEGRVVDIGDHDTLLGRGGLYARLARLQFDQTSRMPA